MDRDGLPEVVRDRLRAVAEDHFGRSMDLTVRFCEAVAPELARACWAMARRFHRGGKILAFGVGPNATDALHISVEFVHPVITGQRALPAVALTTDIASIFGIAHDIGPDQVFAAQIRTLATPDDIAIGVSMCGTDVEVVEGLREARRLGLLTVGIVGGSGEPIRSLGLDFCFVIP